jgi:hypothetical protein
MRCETEDLSDSDYFLIVDTIRGKHSKNIEKFYKQVEEEKNKPEKPKSFWSRLLLFWR